MVLLITIGEIIINIMNETPDNSKMMLWLKRAGFAGFMFFLLKGLAWIAVFIFAAKSCGS